MSIKKVSSKMSKINTAYTKLRREYLTDKPICHAKIHKCSIHATDIHHKQGRGVYHLDTSTWLPVCRNCHNWIEKNPSESYELGFSGSRS
tara:strand:- start:118 stop:387 length:270 start_codon:yes stop_codon:yes gene_type:complete